jgi:hypothetical protein
MTVKELIEELQQLEDQNMEVQRFIGSDWSFSEEVDGVSIWTFLSEDKPYVLIQ